MPRVHVTDRQQYKECRRKDKYCRKEKLEPVDNLFGPLWVGTGLHEVLAAYYRGRMTGCELGIPAMTAVWEDYAAKDVPQNEIAAVKWAEADDLVKAMIENYYHFSRVNDAEWEILGVEKEIEVKIPGTRCTLVATLDLVIRSRGGIYIVDHKGLANLASPEFLEFDDQMTAYAWAAREDGLRVRGLIYNQLRKKKPAIPMVLANGKSLSKNKGVDTTHALYMQAIIANEFDVADYQDILEHLKTKEFVKRELVTRSQSALDTFGRNVGNELREMTSAKTPMFANPTKDCLWRCGYKQLCRCENDGGDIEQLKRVLYRVGAGRS